MPQFKSTYNILVKPDEDEVFENRWQDSDKIILPPNPEWDYSRELQITDIDIWEVLAESGSGLGVYAAWCPHAEFYMVTTGIDNSVITYNGPTPYARKHIETFYGLDAQRKVFNRANDLGLKLQVYDKWIESDQIQQIASKLQSKKSIIF